MEINSVNNSALCPKAVFSTILVLCWRWPLDIRPKYSHNWFPLSGKDFPYCFNFVFVCYGKAVWSLSLIPSPHPMLSLGEDEEGGSVNTRFVFRTSTRMEAKVSIKLGRKRANFCILLFVLYSPWREKFFCQ